MTVSFDAVWAAAVGQHRDLPFLLFSSRDGRVDEWTCGEVDDVVARAGGALRDAGVGPGTAAQMVLRSCPAFVAVWSAVSRLGGWMLPVGPASTRRDLARQVVRIHPAAVLVGHDRAIALGEAVPGFSGQVLVLGEDPADLAPGAPLHFENPVRALPEPGPDQRLAVVLTSGTTETVAPVRTDTSQPPAHDVIGRPMPGRHVRVADLVPGAGVPAGVPGELVVRGARGRDLFASCLDDDAVNARVFTSDGDLAWFRTGDLVSRDSDGVLRFVGRVDDVVKVSGENVSLRGRSGSSTGTGCARGRRDRHGGRDPGSRSCRAHRAPRPEQAAVDRGSRVVGGIRPRSCRAPTRAAGHRCALEDERRQSPTLPHRGLRVAGRVNRAQGTGNGEVRHG